MLTQIQDSLWTVASPLTVLGCIQLNTRMTIIRLQSGKLFLHSPVPWSVELQQAVEQIGEVGFIVAPSCFHHMFVGGWHENNPNAQICAPKGLIKKREDLQIEQVLQSNVDLWEEIQIIPIKGMPIVQEHLFFHKPSQTLIVTDLFFYLPHSTGFTSFYAWVNGVKSTVNTPILFKTAIKDKASFLDSLQILRSLQVNTLSLCHHEVITNNVDPLITQALDKLKVPS